MLASDLLDVAIIGAGPSGASTALHLLSTRPGTRVALFDRARLPREKPCGGAISRWGLSALAAIGATPDDLAVPNVPASAVRVRFDQGQNEHLEPEPLGPLAVVVERAAFDAALAREARKRGAQLHEGHRLVELHDERKHQRLVFEADGQRVEVRARVVVGADGTGSATRRLAGFAEPGPRARLVVLETELAAGEDVDRGEQGGVLEFDLSCVGRGIDGYVWHFATAFGGKRKVSRGIFDWRGRRQGDATDLRATLFQYLDARGVDHRKAKIKPYSERVFVDPDARIATRGLLLVGEAAGLVDPVTGEGIAQAVVSGKHGADELVLALDEGGRVDPLRYRASLSRLPLHRHLIQSAALAPHVYGPRASWWAAALARSTEAVSAGADWYVGRPLTAARKLSVGASFGFQLARAALTVEPRNDAG